MNAHVEGRHEAVAVEALQQIRERVGRWMRRFVKGARKVLEAHGAHAGEIAVRLHLGARSFTAEDVAAAWRSHGVGADLAEACRRSSLVRAMAPPAAGPAEREDRGREDEAPRNPPEA